MLGEKATGGKAAAAFGVAWPRPAAAAARARGAARWAPALLLPSRLPAVQRSQKASMCVILIVHTALLHPRERAAQNPTLRSTSRAGNPPAGPSMVSKPAQVHVWHASNSSSGRSRSTDSGSPLALVFVMGRLMCTSFHNTHNTLGYRTFTATCLALPTARLLPFSYLGRARTTQRKNEGPDAGSRASGLKPDRVTDKAIQTSRRHRKLAGKYGVLGSGGGGVRPQERARVQHVARREESRCTQKNRGMSQQRGAGHE
jgi:hypothetical protein